MSVIIKKGDLLKTRLEPYSIITHQCNCVTIGSAGFAKKLFSLYPTTNTYTKKRPYNKLGTNDYREIGENIFVSNMYAQYYPGKPNDNNDTAELRLKWFKQCLDELSDLEGFTILMPYGIGCGLAGGDWKIYFREIENFSKTNSINVILYQLQ